MLEEHCNAETLAELGEKLESAKKVALSHAHPHAPATPTGNTVADPAAAAADRLRDAIVDRDSPAGDWK